jgi:hypothetical protein
MFIGNAKHRWALLFYPLSYFPSQKVHLKI